MDGMKGSDRHSFVPSIQYCFIHPFLFALFAVPFCFPPSFICYHSFFLRGSFSEYFIAFPFAPHPLSSSRTYIVRFFTSWIPFAQNHLPLYIDALGTRIVSYRSKREWNSYVNMSWEELLGCSCEELLLAPRSGLRRALQTRHSIQS